MEGQPNGMLYTTVKQSIDLPMKEGEYLVEVRAHSEGGDGAVAQVRIAGKTTFTLEHEDITLLLGDFGDAFMLK